MNETHQDLIASMATVNGQHGVMKKVVEECSELIRAISRGEVKNIIEELVDVEIMVRQLLWVLPPGSLQTRDKFMDEKMDRIRGLIHAHTMEKVRAPMMNVESDQGDDAEVNG